MNKKGDFGFEELVKLMIAIVVLVIIIGIIFLLRDKGYELLEELTKFLRFGR